MDHVEQPAYGWFDPEPEEDAHRIPRCDTEGWIKVTRWDRREKVFKVQNVRSWGQVYAEVLYPPGHTPRYENGFGWPRYDPMTKAQALAWLREHNLPLPDEETAEVPDNGHVPEGD